MPIDPKDLGKVELNLGKNKFKFVDGKFAHHDDPNDYSEFFVESGGEGWGEDVDPFVESGGDSKDFIKVVDKLKGGDVLASYKAFVKTLNSKVKQTK